MRNEIERALRLRHDELAIELERLTREPEIGASISFGKRIGDGTSEAVERLSTTAAARSIAASMADLDRALEKLSAGSYGKCDRCSNEIPAARLAALPATATCVDCSRTRT